MSTPSSALPNMPVEPASSQPALSEVERVVDTFIAPRKTFMDLRRSASWWLPFILGAIATMAFTLTVQKKIGWEAVINYRFNHASFLQKIPPEQKQSVIDKQVAGSGRNVYTTPIFSLVFSAILAALLLATFNFGMDAQVEVQNGFGCRDLWFFAQTCLGSAGHSGDVCGGGTRRLCMENPVATHLGAILGSNTDSRYLYHFLASFDLISIWCIFLIGLGMATIANKKIKLGTAITAVALWFLVGDLIRIAFVPFAG